MLPPTGSGTPGPATMDLVPPEVRGNDITDVKPLNAVGGFSNLFVGHKTDLDVDVVIKRVKRNFKGTINEKSEAMIMTALRHQYLPRVYSLRMASDGYVYTIMDKIEGCTLRSYIKAHGALDQKQALLWMKQLCEVISYMHTRKPRGIIHSDIKPENIMITPQGDICVIDFNASLEVSEGMELEVIGATPGFAAPEQYNVPPERFAANDPMRRYVEAAQGYGGVSYKTDIYAIGAIGYYMLTGYDPAIWQDGVVPLSRFNIVLGDELRETIEKAMQPRQADRFSSAAAMLKILNDLGKFGKKHRAWVRECRIAVLAVAICAALSITAIFTGFRRMRQESDTQYQQLVRQAQSLRQSGQYEQSEDLLLQAVNMDGTRVEAYLELGALLYQQREYQQAVDLMQDLEFERSSVMDVTEFESEEGQVYYILGCCYYQLEQYQDALSSYQLATYFLPRNVQAQRDLAICYAKVGNQSMAEQTLEFLRGLNCPEDSLVQVEGEIQYAYGNYEQAYESLSRAAELTTDVTTMNRAYIQAALACQQLGPAWIDTEITLLENGSSRLGSAENGLALQMLAETYLRKSGQPDADTAACYTQALNCLQQLFERGYRTFTVEYNYALVLQYLDRFDEAESLLLEMQSNDPKDYRIPVRLGLLYADRESEKPVEQRNYSAVGDCWEQVQQLYSGTDSADVELLRQLVQQLTDMGWDL